MELLKLNVMKNVDSNFIFMGVVAVVFGMLPILLNRASGTAMTSEMIFTGYVFLFIVLSAELSKNMLQKDKRNKKTEWFLSNGLEIRRILRLYSIGLYLATSLQMLPLILATLVFLNGVDGAVIADFYIFTFIYSILININILFIKNMAYCRGIAFWTSALYLISLFTASVLTHFNMPEYLIKYLLTGISIVYLYKKTDRERIVSTYY